MQPSPLSLYLHVPWCVRKCPYCDFNSHEGQPQSQDYLAALKRDLAQDLDWLAGRKLHSLFVGGGTPSLMPPVFYHELLELIDQRIGFADQAELTLEANPGTADADHFLGYRQAGFNRISLGIQSFDDQKLQRLGRIHHGLDSERAIDMAIQAGFQRLNLDLMFGLPDQSLEQGLTDLQRALHFQPEHLSWYQLTLEPNTQFYHQPPRLPDDDDIFELYEQGLALLASQGLQQYEISAHAKPGSHSRHNLNYWQYGDYLGLGAGAHGKTRLANGQVWRSQKTRLPKDYLSPNRLQFGNRSLVPTSELRFEFLMNALRLKQGVEDSLYTERTGLDLAALRTDLQPLVSKGLLRADRLALTDLGFLHYNTVLEQLID